MTKMTYSNLVKEIESNLKKKLILNPYQVLNSLMSYAKKKLKKKINFNNFNRNDLRILDYIYDAYYNLFIEGEAIKSLNTIIVAPLMKQNNDLVISFKKNNKLQFKNTLVISIYDENKKIFYWINKSFKDATCQDFKNYNFCKYDQITNVDLIDANKLALWFRTTLFNNLIKHTEKPWNTYNLIIFSIPLDRFENYRLYTISDYGIKDPKYDNKLKDRHSFIMELGNNTKNNSRNNSNSTRTSHVLQ